MKALIVCHAGARFGLGHLTRSLVAARALQDELGIVAQFLIQGEALLRPDLQAFAHYFLGVEEDLLAAIRQHVAATNSRVLIFDLYPTLVPEHIDEILMELRQGGCKLISIDCLVGDQANLDLVFVPSFRAPPLQALSGSAPILFGWDCFLLNVKCAPKDWTPGRRVLALTGGSDTTGIANRLPTLLNDVLTRDAELDWVTGPFAQVPIVPAMPRIQITNHRSPSGLDDLMVRTNYALTVYGVSFFELLYYGVPTVVFSPYGDKDDLELSEIASEGVALVARNEADAMEQLKILMADDGLAASLSQRARQRMSVLGGHKFAQAVAALLT